NDLYASNGYSLLYEELLEILINKAERNHHTSSYDIPLIDISRLVKGLPDNIFTNWELGHYSGSYLNPLVSLKKLAQYLGFFVSEGYRRIQNESFDVNICNSDKELINNMIKCASIFGEPRITKKKNSNVVYIRSNNAVAYSILESIGVGVDSKTKRIPPIIFNSPDEVKLEFLKALIAGDGTIDENGKFIKYSSISKNIVCCDLPLLLLMLDIYRFTIKEDQSNNSTIYGIKILQSIADFVDFDYKKRRTSLDLVPNEWIPIKYSKRMSTSLFREKGLYSKVVESDIWFDSVESVEEISTPEFVYDISVKDTERFFAGHAFLGIHNSIYGLLGMKGGVRNASMPCAGITTKLSADLIHWAANQLEEIGLVTELDTDGVWLWVPRLFPLEFPITVKFPYKDNSSQVFKISLIDKILNEKVISTGFRNDNYWKNDGSIISRSSKSLIKFEQDGPYDFQFVMGKKKYIVYNYDENKNEWIEEELTGLESKRADFSQLQKYFQERIIDSYLQEYNPNNPISLDQLYQNAIKAANQIRTEMIDRNLDPSYFVKPKAINKPLKSYKSKLPQVSAAYILKDLGFSVDPGIRIQMLNIKGNHVIPRQIFDFDFNKIKEVLVKHAICTLSFMLGELSTKEDLRKLIDVRQYQEDIFGPGRIYDRMIRYPMEIQKIKTTPQQILDINDMENLSTKRKIGISIDEQGLGFPKIKSPIKKKKVIKEKKKAISRPSRRIVHIESKKSQVRKSTKSKGLDDHLKMKKVEKTQPSEKPTKTKVERKRERGEEFISSNVREIKLDTSSESSILVSEEELNELETNELFTNGLTNNQVEYISEQESQEENIVCSECGALVNPQEITSEGCVFCGGKLISP
ncbi:MAG: LAGLIDADG family homing endonuclease, partial [Candidatus Hodarchaeota archaeon]